MRPDEHKKKRSADYKKKHGADSKQRPPSSRKKSAHQAENKGAGITALTQLDDEDSEGERKFGKKPVESNWSRYRSLSDDEENCGEDYDVLLGQGGDAVSHSKLKGEEEWDKDVTASTFNIDYDHIAAEIAKVPFVERFRLDKLGLDEEILKQLARYDTHTDQAEVNLIPAVSISGSSINLLSKDQSDNLGFNFSLNSMPMKITETSKEEEVVKGIEEGFVERSSLKETDIQKTAIDSDQLVDPTPHLALSGSHQIDVSIDKIDSEKQTQHASNTDTKTSDNLAIDELLQATVKSEDIQNHGQGIKNSEMAESISKMENVEEQELGNKPTEVEDLEDWLDSIL